MRANIVHSPWDSLKDSFPGASHEPLCADWLVRRLGRGWGGWGGDAAWGSWPLPNTTEWHQYSILFKKKFY